MFSLNAPRYFLYREPTDIRRSFDGLCGLLSGREGPDEMLREFSGYLQTDGYKACDHFEKNANITLIASMVHARRKFEHGQENNLDTEAVKAIRQEKSRPVLDEQESWIKEQIVPVPPKSSIGMVMAYTLSLWPRLIRYIDDTRFRIDNNLIENSIRPVVLGRKNYLFADSHEAAEQAAVAYSILATCKLHDVEPFAYLSKILSIIPDFPANQLHKLLPGQ